MNRGEKLYALTTMAQYPSAYAAELRGLKREVLTWKPSASEWSLAEVIAHLADAEEIYLNERFKRVLAADRPTIAGFDQEAYAVDRKYNEQDAMVNLARFARANAEAVSLAWSLAPEGWSRSGIHTEAGELTFRDLLLNLAGHHHSHLNQMRRIKSQYLRAGGHF